MIPDDSHRMLLQSVDTSWLHHEFGLLALRWKFLMPLGIMILAVMADAAGLIPVEGNYEKMGIPSLMAICIIWLVREWTGERKANALERTTRETAIAAERDVREKALKEAITANTESNNKLCASIEDHLTETRLIISHAVADGMKKK